MKRLLPNPNFFLNLLLVFTGFIILHALGIVVPKQPGDLFTTAGGEWMGEDLDIDLILSEHALEKVAWKASVDSKEKRKQYR